LNDFWWKWARRTARADIVAHAYRLALISLEIAQRNDRNATQLPLVIGVFDYCIPCHGKTMIRLTAVRRAPRPFQGLCGLALQPDQFGAPRLRAGLTAKSDERHDRKHVRSHKDLPRTYRHQRAIISSHRKPSSTADLRPRDSMATPQEIANAAVFLASPASSLTTASNLVVDGAISNRVNF